MKILLDNDNVIVADGQEMQEVSNGILVDNKTIYAGTYTIADAEIPSNVKCQAHKYVNGQFVVNENYVQPSEVTMEQVMSKLDAMQQTINELKSMN